MSLKLRNDLKQLSMVPDSPKNKHFFKVIRSRVGCSNTSKQFSVIFKPFLPLLPNCVCAQAQADELMPDESDGVEPGLGEQECKPVRPPTQTVTPPPQGVMGTATPSTTVRPLAAGESQQTHIPCLAYSPSPSCTPGSTCSPYIRSLYPNGGQSRTKW